MISTLTEAEEYLQELESKPFGYRNHFTTAKDFQKMKETLRWTVEELKRVQEEKL